MARLRDKRVILFCQRVDEQLFIRWCCEVGPDDRLVIPGGRIDGRGVIVDRAESVWSLR